MKIRNKLKSFRHDQEMNQVEFAQFLEVAYPTYCNYEKQNRQPSLLAAMQIASKLKCTVNDIFELES